MLNFHHARRFTCLLMVVLTAGCTSVKTVPFAELEDRRQLDGTYIITTRDDRVIKTDRVAIEDSVLVVSAVIIDARRRNVEPFRIPYEDVLSVSQERTNWIVLIGVVAAITACAVAFVAFVSSFGSIGQ